MHILNLESNVLLDHLDQVFVCGDLPNDDMPLQLLVGIVRQLLHKVQRQRLLSIRNLDHRDTLLNDLNGLSGRVAFEDFPDEPLIVSTVDVRFQDIGPHGDGKAGLAALALRQNRVHRSGRNADVVVRVDRHLIIIIDGHVAATPIVQVHEPSRMLGHYRCDIEGLFLICGLDQEISKFHHRGSFLLLTW
ncbi:hypothetical protein [uncultured Duncaniella sp.]|uniref:hypothetical protein n=1 Tax=uncultured Duncaniella sp. TaxID=2768039 RepID=UPI002635607B|nr:hypothetical protein [uncultured Duncaniella sp.]